MADPITAEISERICQHMNEDHSDAVLLYAQKFGNTPDAESAILRSIDPEGMNLSVIVEGKSVPLRVIFDHTLEDSEDAHQTLIAMVKQV